MGGGHHMLPGLVRSGFVSEGCRALALTQVCKTEEKSIHSLVYFGLTSVTF